MAVHKNVKLKWWIQNLMDVGSELRESVMEYICLILSIFVFSHIKM